MSRTTVHSYMEAFGGATLDTTTKDLYLNRTKPLVLSDLKPWGASHIQTNTSYEDIDSVAATAYTQTEYSYPTTNVPMEIIGISVKYSASASFITARCVAPFEHGDDIAEEYTDQSNPVYFLRDNKIVIYPQFDAVVTDSIRVRMTQRLSALSGSVTATGLSEEGENLWALKALQYYWTATNDKRAAVAQAQYDEYLWGLKHMAPIGNPDEL